MKALKTKKQELTENSILMGNGEDCMELFFSEHLNKFCIEFNAKLIGSFKTFGGFVNKRDQMIEKHTLSLM